ncbi:choice-of-anchor D domain-containing protein, partial [candidate division KSB1 bacterium]|nr:choice-of-anchor D domain-containing protein [candidate division KSB1 bacterium]
MKRKKIILTVFFMNLLWFVNYTSLLGAGKFDFNDGTTQGWTLDQMYVTSTQTKFTPVIGYTLMNSNSELLASTGSLLIGRSDQNDIYLESPDLLSNSNWQGIGGISVDVKRLLYSPGWGDFPNIFFVQLQLKVIDTAENNKEKLFAEHDGTNFIFHDITTFGKLYQITWQPSWLTDTRYKVKKIRIRITGPGDVAPELWYRGSWNIDNVTAIGGSTTNNTNPGTNVQVNLGSGVNVTFDNVTGAGNTSLTTSGSGTPPPGGFAILPKNSPTYYSITTTATYAGNIKIGIQYNDAGLTSQQEAALKLQVYEQPPGQWKNITTSVDINANIIYGMVNHLSEFAVMFSTGGTTASWVLTNQPTSGTITCFTVSGEQLFAGSEYGGVFVSANSGDNWNPVNTGLTNLTVRALCANSTYTFAGTWGGGVFRSNNSSISWTPVNTGLTNLNVTSLYYSGTTLIAGTWGGVFLSTNNGTSWTPINTGLTETHVRSVLIKWGNFFAGTINGLFLSTNNGSSWTPMSTGLTNTAAISLVSKPENSAEELFTGTDGGGVFMITTNTNWTPINNGLTNLHIPYLCFGSSNLFAATWGEGVFLTENPGTTWFAFNEGLTNLYIRTLIVNGTNIFAGTNDGGIWRRSISDLISEVPNIAADPTSWNYGSIAVGSNSDKIFIIRNEGTADLNVTGTTLTGTNALEFSIQVGGGAFTLVPGAAREILIKFAPTGAGNKSASLNISSNDPDENPLQINLTGNGASGTSVPVLPTVNNPVQMAGTEFIINIEVGTNGNPIADLFGISFKLNYTNTNYVNFMTAEPGPFIGNDVIFFPTPDDPNGKVAIGLSRKSGQGGVNGFGSITKIKFTTVLTTPHNTTVDFSITDVAANNSAGDPINLTPGLLKINIQSGVLVWPGDTNNNG